MAYDDDVEESMVSSKRENDGNQRPNTLANQP